jgi:excisionase family DNA binding protein
VNPTEIMTVPEVAAYLKMSKSKVYYLIKRREIPHIRIGRNVRVRGNDLENWLKTKVEGQMTLFMSYPD